MAEYSAYHLDLSTKELEGAQTAILPGDPFRVNKIAGTIDPSFKELKFHREYKSSLCTLENQKILIISTGIGGPSTSIAVEELARLGINKLVRTGTCGGISNKLQLGDLIITTGSVRLDGASSHYAPIEYPAVADWELVAALANSCGKLNISFHTGITASSDTFYPGQERYDTYNHYVIKRFQQSMREWQNLNVLNYEMESATLLTMANTFGLKAANICGVVALRTVEETVITDKISEVELNLSNVILETLKK